MQDLDKKNLEVKSAVEELPKKNEDLGKKIAETRSPTEDLSKKNLEVKPSKQKTVIIVADGKSITTLKGIKNQGDVVDAQILGNGQKDIDVLLDKGYLVKV